MLRLKEWDEEGFLEALEDEVSGDSLDNRSQDVSRSSSDHRPQEASTAIVPRGSWTVVEPPSEDPEALSQLLDEKNR